MDRRKFLLGIGSVTGVISGLVGSGAFSVSQLDNRNVDVNVVNDSNALVGLIPNDRVSGVNLVDGQLAIAMADGTPVGINTNSVYQLGAFVKSESEPYGDITGSLFNPIREERPSERDENGNFASAFLVANQTNERKDIKFEFVRNGSQSEGTKFAFEAHYDGEVKDTLVVSDEIDDNELIVVSNLDPGESFGVSLAVNALNGELEDKLTATFSVRAGEAVSVDN